MSIESDQILSKFIEKYGKDTVLLEAINRMSRCQCMLIGKVMATGDESSQADIMNDMANLSIMFDLLNKLFASSIQKYPTRVNEKKQINLAKMNKLLEQD